MKNVQHVIIIGDDDDAAFVELCACLQTHPYMGVVEYTIYIFLKYHKVMTVFHLSSCNMYRCIECVYVFVSMQAYKHSTVKRRGECATVCFSH